VPFSYADRPFRKTVAAEAERFARLMRTVPAGKDHPNHPAIRPMARAFKSLNKALKKRDDRGYVSLASQKRMGQEFVKIGKALQATKPRASGRTKRRATRR